MKTVKTMPLTIAGILCAMIAVSITGCNGGDSQIAREAADRQAQQNTEMARVANQAAEGSRRLVEADAAARKEIVEVHHDLQAERATLGEQWNQLEGERQQMAQDRRTESILVPAIQTIGTISVALLVIGFVLSLLFGLRKDDDTDAQLGELLIQEIVADKPQLLPPRDVPALPGAGESAVGSEANRSDLDGDEHQSLED